MTYIPLHSGTIRCDHDEYSRDNGKTWRPVLTFIGTPIQEYEADKLMFRRPVEDPLAD